MNEPKLLDTRMHDGSRHFDSHAYRTENVDGVKDFARGSMRTYLIYKEKARRWNADKEIRAIVRELGKAPSNGLPKPKGYSRKAAGALKDYSFDRRAMGARGLMYERLDQLTVEVILGVR